jgi:hypothetical protein
VQQELSLPLSRLDVYEISILFISNICFVRLLRQIV